jgi:hypothetical protein
MCIRCVLVTVAVVCLVCPAFGWELSFDFSTDQGWKYFDDDTGAGTSAPSPSGGVMSVSYPTYSAFSWRYVFFDKDSSGVPFADLDLSGGYVEATLSYTGAAPTFAYFFLAGAGNAGDDLIYIDGAAGGSQTFWGTFNDPLTIAESPGSTTVRTDFGTDTFGVFSPGPEHRARRGTVDSWDTTITNVDAVGIVLGYYGDPEGATLNIDEFTVTPEPSLLLLSGPLAGFLGWRIRRRTRKAAVKA